MTLKIRSARPGDAALVYELCRALSDYEGLADRFVSTEADMNAALFDPSPRVFCEIAEWNGEAAGVALWFYSFSTFVGRHGLHLEDLFVRPEHRGRRIGKALMARLAKRCVDENLGRFEWSVVDWNDPAIAFYEANGAIQVKGQKSYRLTGDALASLAGHDDVA